MLRISTHRFSSVFGANSSSIKKLFYCYKDSAWLPLTDAMLSFLFTRRSGLMKSWFSNIKLSQFCDMNEGLV